MNQTPPVSDLFLMYSVHQVRSPSITSLVVPPASIYLRIAFLEFSWFQICVCTINERTVDGVQNDGALKGRPGPPVLYLFKKRS